jgi:hypothetical protein
MKNNRDSSSLIVVMFAILFGLSFSLFSITWLNLNTTQVVGKLEDTIEKVSDGHTKYLVSIQVNGSIEPFELDNNLFIGRFDRTTEYFRLKEIADRNGCVSMTVHGYRIPSISYRGITSYKEVPCK